MPVVTQILAEQPDVNRFGANWAVQFRDSDGQPLNMGSFEQIDFGAISYKEIFQNVKTILATPVFSVPLERTLGVDQTVVDQPMNQATGATIAILDAIYFWEPRAEVVSVDFAPDILTGHFAVNLQLKIKNLFYGTSTPYPINNAFQPPPQYLSGLPEMNIPVPGPPGPTGADSTVPGPQGTRGSLWFFDSVNPDVSTIPDVIAALPNDMFLNTVSYDIFQLSATTRSWELVRQGRERETIGPADVGTFDLEGGK